MILNITINDILFKTLFLTLFLVIGILIGVTIVLIAYLIITLIHKKVKNNRKGINHINFPLTDPNKVIAKHQFIFETNFGEKSLHFRISSLKQISIDLIKDIATIYNPNASNPMFEVSFENILLLSNHIIDEIDNLVNDIIKTQTFKIAWAGIASIVNVSNFIKGFFKKERKDNISLNIRNLKISQVMQMFENNKKEQSNSKEDEYKKIFILDTLINNKIKELIKKIGEEAVLIYSNNINNVCYQIGGKLS